MASEGNNFAERNNEPPKVDRPADSSTAVSVSAPEVKEKEPELSLTVDGPCNNPEGRYVGLNKDQREKLGVEVGEIVELFDGKNSLGVFTVGKGTKELTKTPDKFTANGVKIGVTLTVKKANEKAENANVLPVVYGIESDARTEKRVSIIAERFQGVVPDPEVFMTVPTAVLNQMTGGNSSVAQIALGKVNIKGVESIIVIVPTGKDIGFTTKAAKELKIPPGLKELNFKIKGDVLVID